MCLLLFTKIKIIFLEVARNYKTFMSIIIFKCTAICLLIGLANAVSKSITVCPIVPINKGFVADNQRVF